MRYHIESALYLGADAGTSPGRGLIGLVSTDRSTSRGDAAAESARGLNDWQLGAGRLGEQLEAILGHDQVLLDDETAVGGRDGRLDRDRHAGLETGRVGLVERR